MPCTNTRPKLFFHEIIGTRIYVISISSKKLCSEAMLGSIRARESLSFFRYGNLLAHPSVWDEMSRPDRVRRQRSHAIITGVKYRSCGIYPRGDIPSSSFVNVNTSLRALAQSRLLSHCFGNRRRFSVYFRRVKPEVGLQEREAVNRAGIPKRGGEGRHGDTGAHYPRLRRLVHTY